MMKWGMWGGSIRASVRGTRLVRTLPGTRTQCLYRWYSAPSAEESPEEEPPAPPAHSEEEEDTFCVSDDAADDGVRAAISSHDQAASGALYDVISSPLMSSLVYSRVLSRASQILRFSYILPGFAGADTLGENMVKLSVNILDIFPENETEKLKRLVTMVSLFKIAISSTILVNNVSRALAEAMHPGCG